MSTILPFAALRYAAGPAGDVGPKLSPPYDVLDAADKAALVARDARNFVAVDLPHVPPNSLGPAEAYSAARRTLDEWRRTGVMTADTQPGIYVYHQTYEYGGTRYVRRMFFALLRLEPLGSGSVFPHERTFGGPKEDRLALMKATQANLSPIFGIYPDDANAIQQRLEQGLPAQPIASGHMGDIHNALWHVTSASTIAAVTEMMAAKPTYIADGHHRYGTALQYRDWVRDQRGGLAADHPANYVLSVFCAMGDPGLLILPTHRVLPGVRGALALLRQDQQLEVTPLAGDAGGALAKLGPQAVAVTEGDAIFAVRPRQTDLLKDLEPTRSPAWRRLALAILHSYVIDRVVAPALCGGNAPEIRYIKAWGDAVKQTIETRGTAFLMQPTTMQELRDVCGANDLMPQKSTFFYPKLASGLVVNLL